MLTVKYKGEKIKFKSYREVHDVLDLECGDGCGHKHTDRGFQYDDFGREIGKECVENNPEVEVINEDPCSNSGDPGEACDCCDDEYCGPDDEELDHIFGGELDK